VTVTTDLVLAGVGVPPYSIRGAQQSLQPIDGAAQLRRTVNGDLEDLSVVEARKFKSTVTCTDQQPPAFARLWPGQLVTVDCIAELGYPVDHISEAVTEGDTDDSSSIADSLDRTPVPGSIRVEDGFAFYRPRLSMRVTAFSVTKDEYGAETGWSLDLEEV
jgi:hypothetical protein